MDLSETGFPDINLEPLLERFLRYARTWTTSDSSRADKGVMPSTEGQRELARVLEQELRGLGASDVSVTDNAYVCARIPAAPGMEDVPAVAFLAHMDTTEEVDGKDVKPNVIRGYDGGVIRLAGGTVLDPAEDGALAAAKGDTIITSDGTTLLGADDKAGIAVIMTALEQLLKGRTERARRHGAVEVMFSPDEETGHGMDKVPLEWFTARHGYTVDGGAAAEVESECFNAWKSEVVFTGRAMHTGTARPHMVNAVTMAADFVSFLPGQESPEATDGRLGFYAPMEISGHMESASVTLFLRDFAADGMERRKEFVEQLARAVERKNPGGKADVTHTRQYLNMAGKIGLHPRVTEDLVKAVRQAGLEPVFKPIRGGTDGARLTELGFPCPNIFTGGHNFHSRTEWASLQQMGFAVHTLLNLAALQADN